MNDFDLPPNQPTPSNIPSQAPPGLPPRHKVKAAPPEPAQAPKTGIDALSDDEFDALIQSQLPVIPEQPPQCDWHLNAMFTGDYPDPFTLPALEYAQQSIIHDAAALMEAIAKSAEEQTTAAKDSNNTNSKKV